MKRWSVLVLCLVALLAACGMQDEESRSSSTNPAAGDSGQEGVEAPPHPAVALSDEKTLPEPVCSEKPSVPERLPDAEPSYAMGIEFNKLFETGNFRLGYCLAEVQVSENGTVDSVRVVRPKDPDERLEAVIVSTIASWRYSPATACGRAVAFTMSVGIGHCPAAVEGKQQPG